MPGRVSKSSRALADKATGFSISICFDETSSFAKTPSVTNHGKQTTITSTSVSSNRASISEKKRASGAIFLNCFHRGLSSLVAHAATIECPNCRIAKA
jgi:hypothetical protein